MAYGDSPGPEGSHAHPHLQLRPSPANPGSQGAVPGPLGQIPDSRLQQLADLAPHPQRPRPKTPEGRARVLTAGEARLCRQLFKDSIDYRRVRVHNDEYLPFGLQPDDTAMTPNGEIYFNPKHFKEDFAAASASDQRWFMHEMVHVWQHQLGYPVMWRGAIRIGVEYEYELATGKTLGDYNMEAQGDLLADYFALKFLQLPEVMAQYRYRNDLALYEQVLAGFLVNPADKIHLP